MKHIQRKWIVILALFVAIAALGAFTLRGGDKPAYTTQRVQQGDIRQLVQATGTIDAVTTVQVGSQISGTISKLNADFNTRVKKGQVVAELDPALFQGALLQAQADLQNAEATAAAAKAELLKAQATAAQTQKAYERSDALAKEGVIAAQQLDIDKATSESNQAGVASAAAQVKQANAQVAQKLAAVKVAQTNLDHTIIRSPIDGTVTARSIDVGQTVAASLQAPTLFTIAQDLTKMRVYAKTDESDVGQIRPGQPGTFSVDAFPNEVFRGTVEQVRMNPTTVQNVVTYDTVIAFDNPQQKLFPGMTAYVTIPVAQAANVIEVPNAALRFKPDLSADKLQQLFAANGIQSSGKGRQSQQAVVWKLDGTKNLVPVQIVAGLTDHVNTAVTKVVAGGLNAGDVIVTGKADASKPAASAARSNASPATPRVGGMGGGGNRMGR
ncbi:MAG TPA: efflux RND transporter periplasmic adaptor subunit [Terriglobales bacterium]|jgi:HlyD family secretion protein|nr:efflux RND transporter periplasmic adaptor subunit [Terriglobales bacterium]